MGCVLVLCLAAMAGRAGDQDLLGAGAWKAGPSTPEARPAEGGGAVFPVPFGRRDDDRFYWDFSAPQNLDPYRVLELDFTLDRPEALRALTIYLESGAGWYAWSRPPAQQGRQLWRLSRTAFTAEGNPAGWGRITRIRLSPWRGEGQDAELTIHALRARTAPVLVLQGTRSQPSPGERRAAAAAARRVAAGLDTVGVPHVRVTEDGLEPNILAGVRTLILPYNAQLPDDVWERVRGFHEAGGRLVVFYSADARLAGLLGLRLGDYLRAEDAGRWSAFRFEDPAGLQVPDRVLQASFNIRPAWPAGDGSRVIAWWENAEGERAPEPAWTEGRRGLWMSHILQEGDAFGKALMLAGLLTRLDPGLWPDVSEAVIERCGRIDSFDGPETAAASIRAVARGHRQGPRIRAALDEALVLAADLEARRRRGVADGLLGDAARLRALLTEAYARVQRPRPHPHEFRGVWDHGGAGWFPGDWDRSARILADHGMTAIFPNLLWAGRAHFPSANLPGSDTLRRHGDQAEQVMRAARAHGLEVHVWKVCWNLSAATPEQIARFRAEGRLQADAEGREIPWLNPAHPANAAYEMAGLREVVRRYRPDGVHLDYIRYPDRRACYAPASREAFERRRGRPVPRWPGDVREGGVLEAEYEAWRREVITDFVRRVRGELRAIDPDLQLSAAVFGAVEDARRTIGQDWTDWLRRGLIDFAVPMNYTDNPGRFAGWTADHIERTRGRPGRVYPGIGVTSNEAELTPDGVIEQVVRARRLGAGGFVLFSLTPELRAHTLPALRQGVTAPLREE